MNRKIKNELDYIKAELKMIREENDNQWAEEGPLVRFGNTMRGCDIKKALDSVEKLTEVVQELCPHKKLKDTNLTFREPNVVYIHADKYKCLCCGKRFDKKPKNSKVVCKECKMKLEEIEGVMEDNDYIDVMGGKIEPDRIKSEIDAELYMNLTIRDVTTMLIYLEKQPNGAYQIRSYIPKEEFRRIEG